MNIKKSITLRILVYILVIIAIFLGIGFAFFLMNQASTLAFILGILVFILVIGLPLEFIIKKQKTNTNK